MLFFLFCIYSKKIKRTFFSKIRPLTKNRTSVIYNLGPVTYKMGPVTYKMGPVIYNVSSGWIIVQFNVGPDLLLFRARAFINLSRYTYSLVLKITTLSKTKHVYISTFFLNDYSYNCKIYFW